VYGASVDAGLRLAPGSLAEIGRPARRLHRDRPHPAPAPCSNCSAVYDTM